MKKTEACPSPPERSAARSIPSAPSEPLQLRSLGSGSSGNALLISVGDRLIAVDCGIGYRALVAGLAAEGRRLEDVDAVLLTHEHADHVRCLPQVVRAGVPLVCTAGTARAAGVPSHNWEEIHSNAPLTVAGLQVRALPVSHDAAEPCGFFLEGTESRVTIVTDLGCGDEALRDPIAASDLIVIEANHDEVLLRRGPYPAHLKRRVLSPSGHLSNAQCAETLAIAFGDDTRSRTIWLAHLSQTNNRPEIARAAVTRGLADGGAAHTVTPLPRRGAGPTWRSDQVPEVGVQMALPFSP